MILDTITKPFSYLYFKQVKKIEKNLGYRLILSYNNNWINGTMIFDMTSVWKKYGINATGVNYFTIGNIKDGQSTRFDYLSPYYQSWLGGYVVRFQQNREWTSKDHFDLGIADQKQWLSMYGDPDPYVAPNQSRLIDNIKIQNYKTKLYEGSGWSNTDVGDSNRNLALPLLLGGFANILQFTNPKLKLSYANFIPKAQHNNLLSYQRIYLKGYVAVVDITNNTKAVLYANAAIFKDKNNKEYDYYSQIKNELYKLITSIKIEKV